MPFFRGNIVSELKEMNENKAWRDILGLKGMDKNQKDVEMVLRLFSLFNVWNEYKKPMIQHLNKFMSENRDFSSENAVLFKDRFVRAVNIVKSAALNKPFRPPRRGLNNAILDSVMIAVLENDRIAPDMLRRKYPILLKDREFKTHVTGGTTDTVVVKKTHRDCKKNLRK